jgi:hypothetical protein
MRFAMGINTDLALESSLVPATDMGGIEQMIYPSHGYVPFSTYSSSSPSSPFTHQSQCNVSISRCRSSKCIQQIKLYQNIKINELENNIYPNLAKAPVTGGLLALLSFSVSAFF